MPKVNIQQLLEAFIDNLTEEQCESLTFKDLTEFCKKFIRESAYQEFPSTDPKVLEAMLLLFSNLVTLQYEKLGLSINQTVLSTEGHEYNLEAMRTATEITNHFGKSLRKTLKELSSV